MKKLNLILMLCCSLSLFGQFGSGRDSVLSVHDTMVVNAYFPVTNVVQDTTNNQVSFSTSNAVLDTARRRYLLHQTIGTSQVPTGRWAWLEADSIVGNVLWAKAPLLPFDATGMLQLVSVPQYDSLTIDSSGVLTALPFDYSGRVGGILAVWCKTPVVVRSGGKIDVSGLGFAGGQAGLGGIGGVGGTGGLAGFLGQQGGDNGVVMGSGWGGGGDGGMTGGLPNNQSVIIQNPSNIPGAAPVAANAGDSRRSMFSLGAGGRAGLPGNGSAGAGGGGGGSNGNGQATNGEDGEPGADGGKGGAGGNGGGLVFLRAPEILFGGASGQVLANGMSGAAGEDGRNGGKGGNGGAGGQSCDLGGPGGGGNGGNGSDGGGGGSGGAAGMMMFQLATPTANMATHVALTGGSGNTGGTFGLGGAAGLNGPCPDSSQCSGNQLGAGICRADSIQAMIDSMATMSVVVDTVLGNVRFSNAYGSLAVQHQGAYDLLVCQRPNGGSYAIFIAHGGLSSVDALMSVFAGNGSVSPSGILNATGQLLPLQCGRQRGMPRQGQNGQSGQLGQDALSGDMGVFVVDTIRPLQIQVAGAFIPCGDSLASVSVTAMGGTQPYIGTETRLLPLGSHVITVYDAEGVILSDTILISSVNNSSIRIVEWTIAEISCNGICDGGATPTCVGGVGALTFHWSNGTNLPGISSVCSGRYALTISDGTACVYTDSISIIEPALLETGLIVNNIRCFGESNGQANLNVRGGVQPYAVVWSNGQSGMGISDLSTGAYGVTLTDRNGCSIDESWNIAMPPPFNVSVSGSNETCLGRADGQLLAHPSGGVMPYQYDWGNGSDDAYQTQLPSGFYRLIATDANGCVKEDALTLLSGSTLVLTIDTLVLSHCSTQASTLEMNVAGGVEPYRYFVNGIASNSDFEAWAEDSTLVQVMDANGCSAENGLFLPAFPAPEFLVRGYGSCGNDESYLLVNQPDTTEIYRFGFNSEAPTSLRQWQGRPGTYSIHIVREQDGCAWDTVGEIPFWEPIQVDLQAVSTIRLGDSITLSLFNGTVPSQLVVSWNSSDSMSCINCFDPRVSPVSESVYEYAIMDTLHGCRKSALHLVRVLPSTGLFIPTAFSPDGDGVNDVFWVAGGNSIAEVERMDIFDRTGNLVYSNSHFAANDPTIGWDGNMGGTSAGVGVYVYAIVYRTIDGQVFAQNGDITLVR